MDHLTDPALLDNPFIQFLLVCLSIALLGLLGVIRLVRKPWRLY